ncbi:hypothetical protein ACFVIM_33275 [Streptomyces sp. NPDC057638]|uniref:hypothetical protein n=1 Tax=Streptomyces sp. NPDC057638 TaxID=3346190 RepID=UPI0036A3CD13
MTLTAESARIASETGSARHRAELETLRRTMDPWRDDPLGDRLDQALAPLAP